MHHALTVLEILEHVASHLQKTDLSSLLRVCRAFYTPVQALLYSDLSLSSLALLLPRIIWPGRDNPASVSSLVKSLDLREAELFHRPDSQLEMLISILADMSSPNDCWVPFPRLKHISGQIRTRSFSFLILSLISPTLRSLSLDVSWNLEDQEQATEEVVRGVSDVLHSLGTRAPNLLSLSVSLSVETLQGDASAENHSLYHPTPRIDIRRLSQAVFEAIKLLWSIQCLSFYNLAISPSSIVAVRQGQRLPQVDPVPRHPIGPVLQHLQLSFGSSNNLQALGLAGPLNHSTLSALCLVSWAPLTRLCIHVTSSSSLVDDILDVIPTFARTLVFFECYVEPFWAIVTSDAEVLGGGTMMRLGSCHLLESVDLSLPGVIDVGLSLPQLSQVARSWGRLQHVSLSFGDAFDTTPAGVLGSPGQGKHSLKPLPIDSWSAFGSHCPELVSIFLHPVDYRPGLRRVESNLSSARAGELTVTLPSLNMVNWEADQVEAIVTVLLCAFPGKKVRAVPSFQWSREEVLFASRFNHRLGAMQ